MFGGLATKIATLARKFVAPVVERRIYSWGRNQSGVLGLNIATTQNRSSPVQVGTGTDWSTSTVSRHALAVKTGGTLWGWGRGSGGVLGNNSSTYRSSPVQVGTDTNWSKVSAGWYSSAAIRTTGTLWTWGSSSYGQGGRGNTTTISSPVQVGSGTNWAEVSSGRFHVVAETTGGQLWSWGQNGYGELGVGNTTNRSSPVQIGTGTDWSSVDCGRQHTLAVKTTGTLWAWGRNQYGQLGLLNTTNRSSPVQIGTATDWSRVSAGGEHSLGVKTTGTLWAWGRNSFGQLGVGNVTNRSSPVQVGSDSNWSSAYAGSFSSFAIKSNGTIWAWGMNTDGFLGLGYSTTTDTVGLISSPVLVNSDSNWSENFAAANWSTMAIKTTGTLWGWGNNNSGNLGLNDTVSRIKSPVQVGSDTNWAKVSARGTESINYTAVAAIKTNGTLWTWGSNIRNQLPALTGVFLIHRSSPVQIGSDTDWSSVSVGGNHMHAIKTTGTLWGWGDEAYGQVGVGVANALNTQRIRSPIQLGTGSSWSQVSAGWYHSAAIKTDGTLWIWGRNNVGQLGDGSVYSTEKSSPVQVGSSSDWSKLFTNTSRGIASQRNHTILIKSNGTMWAAGNNDFGQLGLGDTIGRLSPVQIGTGSNWSKASTGGSQFAGAQRGFTAAVKTDGTLWTWGSNGYGQLGHGAGFVNRSSPVQVGTDTDWSDIKCGENMMLALKTTGSMWSWGRGDSGVLGLGDSANRNSPVQIGTGTDWSVIEAGQVHCMAIKTGGTLWAWGTDGGAGSGRLGLNATTSRSSPVQVGTDANWASVSVSRYATTAIRTTGTMWSWGRGSGSSLGIGLFYGDRSSPVQVGTDTNWSKVSRSYNHGLAIKTTGTLWSWGSGSLGVLGTGSTTSTSKPTQIGTDSNWSEVRASAKFTIAIRTNGTIWGWGRNYEGSALFDAKFHTSSPVQVGSGTDWAHVACGSNTTLAVKTGGTLWGWGANGSGQLGLGDVVSRSSPVQIGTSTDWSKVYSNLDHSMARKTSGTLWAWGGNVQGQLGVGTVTSISSPVQVGTGTNWSAVSLGSRHSIMRTTTPNLFGTGRNSYGRITTAFSDLSSPVQIGTTADWKHLSTHKHAPSYNLTISSLGIRENIQASV